MSRTDLVKSPGVSNDVVVGRIPVRESSPRLGRRPYKELKAAGQLTDPVVSVPKAMGVKPAETATPAPEEEPQGSWNVSVQ